MRSLALIIHKLKVADCAKSLQLKLTFRHNLVQYGSSIFNVFHFAYSQGGRAGYRSALTYRLGMVMPPIKRTVRCARPCISDLLLHF